MGVEQPDVRYGENSDWKPESTNSKSTMSGGFESTDTPDFFTEASEKLAQQIELNMSVVTELEQAGEAVKISDMKRELVERESRVLRGCNEILDRTGE